MFLTAVENGKVVRLNSGLYRGLVAPIFSTWPVYEWDASVTAVMRICILLLVLVTSLVAG